MGDAIWPEENFAMVIWCEDEEARTIAQALAGVKERFPDEGIKLFGLRSGDTGGAQTREALPAPAETPPRAPEPEGVEGLAGLAGLE
jgi:hypothetical protein